MSSSPTVRQRLQSCMEPLLFEPRDLMHQLLPSSKSLLSFPCPQKQTHDSLSKPSHSNKNGEEAYVHPLSKSFLSSKSLEMCTESLGCETGSGIDEFSNLAAAVEVQSCGGVQHARKQQKPIKKAKHGGSLSFPPPLTSINGSRGGVQVHTHREGGRLVIKAFASSSSCCFFQAERGNGRLRLSLLKDGGGEEEGGDGEEGFGGPFWGENIKEDGGKVWSSSRCNGDRSNRKGLQSLPFCVVGV